jgi:hypothetical protein
MQFRTLVALTLFALAASAPTNKPKEEKTGKTTGKPKPTSKPKPTKKPGSKKPVASKGPVKKL